MNYFIGLLVYATFMLSGISLPLVAEETTGWLEGTVKDEFGNPLDKWIVQLYNSDGTEGSWSHSIGSQGGFYSIRNIKPNVYEVRIYTSSAWSSERENELRQQRLFGVTINKGTRSLLDIKLKEGKSRDFEEVGKPNVQTQKVMLIMEEIDRLKEQIRKLEKTSGDSTN